MKVALVVFSTNRLEFLIPSLKSQYLLDFGDMQVYKIFIDDFPTGRNNTSTYNLLKYFEYDEVILHDTNKGLSVTWTEVWEKLKSLDIDYIYFQEDDIVYKCPIHIPGLLPLLDSPTVSQLRFERQPWYPHETSESPYAVEIYKQYNIINGDVIFSPMASIFKRDILDVPFKDYADINLNEGFVGQVLATQYNKYTCKVLNNKEEPLIEHIGEWNIGKIVLPNEPSYVQLYGDRDTSKKRCSRTGANI